MSTISLKDEISQEILDNETMAEMFAKQFDKSFSQSPNIDPTPSLSAVTRIQNSKTTIDFTEEKVNKALQNMKRESSPGPDRIPTVFLQNCSDALSPIMAEAMQEGIELGKIPKQWKLSTVIPLFKKGDRHKVENYRPISLCSNPLKCMEKVIVKELMSFFQENNLIPSSQHGFIPKRSTTTNLIECLNDWTKNHDNSIPTDVIYLDYEKAFDKVPHNLLLLKIEHFGVRGKLLNMIAELLKERYLLSSKS